MRITVSLKNYEDHRNKETCHEGLVKPYHEFYEDRRQYYRIFRKITGPFSKIMKLKSEVISCVIILGHIVNIKSSITNSSLQHIGSTTANTETCLQNVDINIFQHINNSILYLCISNSPHFQLTEDSFHNFTRINTLLLLNVSIAELPSTVFEQLRTLTELDLSDNQLKTLPPSIFSDCIRLKVLILKNNRFDALSPLNRALLPLHNLYYLDLSSNNFSSIEPEDLVLENLETLKLGNCGLKKVNLTSFVSLRRLYLNNNQLKSETLSLKMEKSQLQELYLGNEEEDRGFDQNDFSTVGENLFDSLHNLTLLDLRRSSVSTVAPSAFRVFTQLKTLNLSANNLLTVPSTVLRMETLRELDMSYNGYKNEIFDVKEIKFDIMVSLQAMDLSNNNIIELKSHTFVGLGELKYLALKNAQLETIEPYSFSGLHSLLHLDLSTNFLSEIVNDTFAELFSLVYINLSRNNLKIYPHNHPFLSLHNLQTIEFQYNSLCEIWPWLITDLSNLTYMDMSYNKIVGWRWRAFPKSNSLKTVYFQNNEIKTISTPMLQDLLTLDYGDFSNNPYNCSDCEVINLQDWMQHFNVGVEEYKCLYTFRGELYVVNSTVPLRCQENSSFNYVPLGIAMGILFILIVTASWFVYNFRWYLRYRWYVTRCHLKNWNKPLQRKKSHLYDAFISYCEKDCYWVKKELIPRLETRFRFCVHERDFEAGKNITDNIFEGIDKSKMFIAVLTEDFLLSQWCMWELNMAISKMAVEQQDNLLIIKLHTISKEKMSRIVQYLLKTKTYLSWAVTPAGQRLFWERLIHILEKNVSSST
ncbi:toll-like receptor 13 isoform X1 [Centruroides vittatus]|uniref:toll-like receptor 13 isoform X1 n=2 Tax=Centruroides vittatus TaxID=120091 RepID=UPI00350FD207